jgi:uncharacterized protein
MGTKCPQVALICKILVIVGALNWGLVGALDLNLVDSLLGAGSMAAKAVYVLVGLAGVMMLVCLAKGGKCGSSCAPSGGTPGAM